jgi:hypothetical protein
MNGNTERLRVEQAASSYPLQDQEALLISESARARDIAPALLPSDDPGKGLAGRLRLREGGEAETPAMPYAPILAGKRETAEQVRPDCQPVKPRLLFGRNDLHQLGGFKLMRCLHGSMLPACTIKGQRAGGKNPPKPSGLSTGLKIEKRGVFQGQAPRPLGGEPPRSRQPQAGCEVLGHAGQRYARV